MNVEGYSILDLSSPIIGYSLFFHEASGHLVIIDASVNPLNREALKNTTQLINHAFDSISTGENSKLYFLGIHDLDNKRVLKIMVREDKTPMGIEYTLRYATSYK
jgi:hypothetical protein